jgi:hypothetical protein
MEGAPPPGAAPTGVSGAPAYYGTVARPRFYTPIPDILVLLADILVIVGFFLPWIVAAGEGLSPLSMNTGSNTAWWLWIIPFAMAAGCLGDFIISLVRILGAGRKVWRKYSYFANMGGLVVAGVAWWMLLLYVPTYSSELGSLSVADMMGQMGLSISIGIGLIFLFVAAGIQLLAGILAYSLSANR